MSYNWSKERQNPKYGNPNPDRSIELDDMSGDKSIDFEDRPEEVDIDHEHFEIPGTSIDSEVVPFIPILPDHEYPPSVTRPSRQVVQPEVINPFASATNRRHRPYSQSECFTRLRKS